MKNFIRIFVVIFITWCLIAQLYFLAGLLTFWYLVNYRGHELVIVAVLVDGYYQSFYSFPILSISTISLVFLIDIIKPRLLMYTGNNEVVS